MVKTAAIALTAVLWADRRLAKTHSKKGVHYIDVGDMEPGAVKAWLEKWMRENKPDLQV